MSYEDSTMYRIFPVLPLKPDEILAQRDAFLAMMRTIARPFRWLLKRRR